MKKPILHDLAFSLEDDDRINFVFNGETLAFTLILKEYERHKSFQKIKQILSVQEEDITQVIDILKVM